MKHKAFMVLRVEIVSKQLNLNKIYFQMPGKPKGLPKTGGRKVGTPNKATQEARQAIASFVDGNAHRLTEWLDKVADGDPEHDVKPNPAKAFELFQSVVEYHIPKLARSEMSGPNGGPIQMQAVEMAIIDPHDNKG